MCVSRGIDIGSCHDKGENEELVVSHSGPWEELRSQKDGPSQLAELLKDSGLPQCDLPHARILSEQWRTKKKGNQISHTSSSSVLHKSRLYPPSSLRSLDQAAEFN